MSGPTKDFYRLLMEGQIIQGKWGNGAERKRRLELAGYGYRKVQDEVNRLLR
ncbi:MAG: hypothetical protein K6G43_08415 [Lachnospiraceae bacterium]|nr:hypothetical protein [Lachnospiraceae bacterium]